MGLNDLAAPLRYAQAQTEKKAAYERYNYASAALELATIRERFMELYSQFDPVNKIKDLPLEERERLCASAYYVMYGRLPDKKRHLTTASTTPATPESYEDQHN